jgi:hypothetical protein
VSDVVSDIPVAARPAPSTSITGDSVPLLLVGSDSRALDNEARGAHSGAIMLARITGDREHGQLVSNPPRLVGRHPGYRMNKIKRTTPTTPAPSCRRWSN